MMRGSKSPTFGKAGRVGSVSMGIRPIDRMRVLIEHTGMPTDAIDGIQCGQFPCKKAL